MGVNGLSKLNVQINFLYNLHYERLHMAKRHRDVLRMQLDMLVKCKAYNEEHSTNPNTRQASGLLVTDPMGAARPPRPRLLQRIPRVVDSPRRVSAAGRNLARASRA